MRNKALLSVGVALIAIGCSQSGVQTVPGQPAVELATQVVDGITTVSLNVPNMH